MVIKLLAAGIIVFGGMYNLARGETETVAGGFEGTGTDTTQIILSFYNGLWAYDGWYVLVVFVTYRFDYLPNKSTSYICFVVSNDNDIGKLYP